MSRKTPYWAFGGGLDLVTPAIQIPDGRMIAGTNFEPWINGGYRRIKGYERYDGRPAPSDATYLQICLDAIGSYVVGNTITGDTSAATGVIVAVDESCVVVTKVTGLFQDDETTDTAAATITSIATEAADTALEFETRRFSAEEEYRGDITQVPGLNAIRGIYQIRDRVYAIRDNVGETAGVIHKATASGWSSAALTMSEYLYFAAGSVEINVGDTVTGFTSGATGFVHRVVVHSGSYGTNDAAGYIVFETYTGTFLDGEDLNVDAVKDAEAVGTGVVFELPVGGRYSFVAENFLAGSDTYRLYCAGGVGPAFEIDENDVVTPILMDLSLGDAPGENNPYLVEKYDGKLWLGFPGGSLQASIVGDPLTFNGFLGAAEFGLGEEITGLHATAGQVLVAYTRRDTHAFYISGESYQKRKISDRAGAILYSTGELSTLYSVDDSGLIDLRRVETFGDFAESTVSDLIQPLIDANKERIAGVMMIRESNQYRVLFENGDGVVARMRPDGLAEFGAFKYPDTVNCAYWCEDENGTPTYWFGGASGFVYQSERGRNFDGAEMESFMRLPYNHQGTPASRKRYRLAELELRGEREVRLRATQELSYSSTETGTHTWNDTVLGGGGFYDLDNWDEIYWDAQVFNTARYELLGTGKNISLLFYHTSATTEPFILQGCTLHYDDRRVQR